MIEVACLGRRELMLRVLLGVISVCLILVKIADAELFLFKELARFISSTLSILGGPSTY
jgi:hypothetical protein